uniref:RRM domain-containing protein n=1 Tax=viral metagenome TaxID=1070528 RepID=A0A6C0DTH4_9ZZZZ
MSNNSFYIPAVRNISECDIARIFLLNNIGIVDRVDFFENSAGVPCAFVHFEELYNNETVTLALNQIEIYGSYKFWFSENEYFILKEMNCPKIPVTYMNIHQIADKLTKHEAKIVENDARIAELEAKILEQDKIIHGYRQKNLETIEYGRLAHRAMWARSPSSDSYDVHMDEMVNSLISPSWPEEDDSGFPGIYPEESDDTMSV